MRKIALSASLALLATACTRDLSLPPPPGAPGAGSIAGRVVYAQPGAQTKLAAFGARVELLGTGRVTYADSEGRFVLEGIDFTADQLLVQFDPAATGTPSRQKLLDLGAFAPKPGLQLSIGDVPVNENARLRGRIQRADAATAGGHAGTVVYVPQGPFTTFTNDDGSFELRDLPEGTVSVAAFRTGYESVVVDSIALRSGEDFQLRELSLQPLTGGGTGAAGKIRGTVTYDPPASGAGTTSVAAVDGTGGSHAAAAAADGSFLIENVPPGVYQLTAVRLGYAATIVPNVAVAPGGETTVSGLRLAAEATGGVCVPSTACQPPGADGACKIGLTSCTGGTTCTVAGNAIDGTACGNGAVCRAGECKPVCDSGRVCTPANRCHVGVVVCAADGSASCVDIGAQLPDGYACDAGQSCSAGVCIPCTGAGCGACSVQCVPANACHVGARSCATGSSGACTDTGLLRPDGTGCGTNLVCRAGGCMPCAEGNSCEAATNRCKVGFVACATGFPVCTEGADKPDGTPCGSGDVCRTGACVPAGGQVQTLVPGAAGSASFRNLQVASNGDVYWSDYYNHTVKRLPASGGAPAVIAGKAGQAGASADNQPATEANLYYPYALALDEAAGLLYVSDSYNLRIRAVQLGGNKWILAVAGGGNQPAPGYGDGGPAASAELAYPDGMALGTDGGRKYLYFRDPSHSRFRRVDLTTGVIEAWDIPTSCTNPVALSGCGGQNSCGLVSAGAGGMFVSGLVCGTAVGTQTYGIIRIPPGGGAPVHVLGRSPGLTTEGGYSRATSLAEPAGMAVDSAGNLYYTTYPSNVIRRVSPAGVVRTVAGTGAASSLGDGGTALEASFNGPTSLDFNRNGARVDAVIAETRGNVVRRVLGLGTELFQQGSLSGTAGSTDQTTLTGKPAPALLGATLLDAAGGAMVGFDVAAVATSTPAGVLGQSTAQTDVNGTASFLARAGFVPGDYTFRASYRDIYGAEVPGSPVTFKVTATEPAAGTIMTVVNEDRVADSSNNTGFGPIAHTYYPISVVAAADGTIYFTAHYAHRILALLPDGRVSVVAGTGSAAFSGDGGLATAAQLYYPWGLALDDAGTRLFIADEYNQRVRVVDLATGIISTLAGNGTAVNPSTGDGGFALAATLYYPTHLAQRGGKLYIADNGAKVRVVDLTASPPTIDTALGDAATCTGAVNFRGCAGSYACGLAVDAAGALYVSGQVCGTFSTSQIVSAIVKWDGTTLTHIAGRQQAGSTDADGVPASLAYFSQAPALVFGPGGRLFVADTGGDRIRFIDQLDTIPRNRRWFGASAPGYAGNYASVVTDPFAVSVNNPTGMAFTAAGHLVVADYSNHAVRLVWKAASVLP